MFYAAYQHIYAKEGNMTKGSNGQTIDSMSLETNSALIVPEDLNVSTATAEREWYDTEENFKEKTSWR